MFTFGPPAVGESDPLFGFVELLLRPDLEANGTAVLTDRARGRALVGAFNGVIEAPNLGLSYPSGPFGGNTLRLAAHAGAGGLEYSLTGLAIPADTPWCFEAWFLFKTFNASFSHGVWELSMSPSTYGTLWATIVPPGALRPDSQGLGNVIPATFAWHHLCVQSNGDVTSSAKRFYFNGVGQSSWQWLRPAAAAGGSLRVGRTGAFTSFEQHMGPARFTVGAMRYPHGGPFSPPTSPFPVS